MENQTTESKPTSYLPSTVQLEKSKTNETHMAGFHIEAIHIVMFFVILAFLFLGVWKANAQTKK